MGFDVENGCMMAVKQVQIGIVNTAAQQEVNMKFGSKSYEIIENKIPRGGDRNTESV